LASGKRSRALLLPIVISADATAFRAARVTKSSEPGPIPAMYNFDIIILFYLL
jgi:hypothetical protein